MNVKTFMHTVFFFLSCMLYAAEPDTASVWVIAAAEFEASDIPELYNSYTKIVPEMLTFFCSEPVQRHVSIEEKKARKLLAFSEKKLSLIKERAAAAKEHDLLYLAVTSPKQKEKKAKVLAKKKAAKEQEIVKLESEIQKLLEATHITTEVLPMALWNSGTKIFKQPEHTSTAYALKNEKIDAVIKGKIEDLAGYLYISAVLTTGLPGIPEYHFSEAGAYQNIENIVQALAVKILAAARNIKPIQMRITAEPQNAEIYIGDRKVEAGKKPILVFAGIHRIEARADGYETAYKTITVAEQTNYNLTIKLKKEKTVSIGFTFADQKQDVFLHTQYFGTVPSSLEIPVQQQTLLTFLQNDIRTYLLINPKKFVKEKQSVYTLDAALNKAQTKLKIERQRKILYWSLGAFYASLPIFMILQGVTADMSSAFTSQALSPTDSAVQKYRQLFISTAVMQGITIALGINYAVQLGLYLYEADKSIPREAKPAR